MTFCFWSEMKVGEICLPPGYTISLCQDTLGNALEFELISPVDLEASCDRFQISGGLGAYKALG